MTVAASAIVTRIVTLFDGLLSTRPLDALHALLTLLLQARARHVALTVELVLADRSARVLEACFRPCVERRLLMVSGLHPQPVAIASERGDESGLRLVLADVAVEHGGRQRKPGRLCRVLWRRRKRRECVDERRHPF